MTRLVAVTAVLGIFVLSAAIGRAASRYATRPVTADPDALYSDSGYAAATVDVEGRLDPLLRQALRARMLDGGALLVLLREVDIATCEDLGRQLRELRRSAGARVPMIVLTESAALPVTADFLRLERIDGVETSAVALAHILEGQPNVPTPAVLAVDSEQTVIAGVAHPVRFPNARFRSFADELRDAIARLTAAG